MTKLTAIRECISSVTSAQNLELPGVLFVTPKTFWWRQNEAREKSARRYDELMKQIIVSHGVQKGHIMKSTSNWQYVQSQRCYCASCSFNLLQAHERFSLRILVPLRWAPLWVKLLFRWSQRANSFTGHCPSPTTSAKKKKKKKRHRRRIDRNFS